MLLVANQESVLEQNEAKEQVIALTSQSKFLASKFQIHDTTQPRESLKKQIKQIVIKN